METSADPLLRHLFLSLISLAALCGNAYAQSGFVKSGGQSIPGATVTVTQGQKTSLTVTDADGHYGFAPLEPGAWHVRVEIFGFQSLEKDADFAAATGPVNFDLQLKPSAVLERLQQFAARRSAAGWPRGQGSGQPSGRPTGGNPGANGAAGNSSQQLDQQLQSALEAQTANAPAAGNDSSNESFLVSGSLSPGLAQGSQADSGPDLRSGFGGPGGPDAFGGANGAGAAPGFQNGSGGPDGTGGPGGFGGPGGGPGGGFGGRGGGFGGGRGGGGQRRPGQTAGATFGNRRRRNQQIHGQASFTLTNSALNAKPFSINGLDVPQAAYAQSRFSFIIGGPLVIPHIVKDSKTQFFLTYFGTRSRTPQLFAETVPTMAERNGDFSQATQSLGTSATNVGLKLFDPTNGQPFANNQIPQNRLSPIALNLLRFYPLPNQPGNANNYQFETAQASNSDNVGFRIQRSITSKDRLSANIQYQRRDSKTANAFGYADPVNGYGLNTQLQWTRNLSTTAINNAQVRFNRNYTLVVPFFSTLPNIDAQLNLAGASTNPLDFGPPTLNFNNFGSLTDSAPRLSRNQTQGVSDSVTLLKGTHSISLGVGYTRPDVSTRTDPNARGTFNFTGLATSQLNAAGQPMAGTGYDLADFLLGYPQSSSIQYTQFTDYFVQNQWNSYAQDEWKARPNLTITAGVRYEYFSPFNEKYGHLTNLDIAPGFANVFAVRPGVAGAYTGVFPSGLIDHDHNNFSPRLALAWKITQFKKSTVARAGYGIYYNGQAYLQFATSLSDQYPFAVSNTVNTNTSNLLTVDRGFTTTAPNQVSNSFAVARDYRTPYAGTWNVSIQRDLGRGFFMELLYMGTKGTGLDVRTVPNQAVPGSAQLLTQATQAGNAAGFIYDQSVGNSIFNAGQARLVRRFNHGISMNLFYQFAKSIDDSSTLGGGVATTAQNWLDIEAERGLSSFDVRHQLNASFVWTSPVGDAGSRIPSDSTWGRLLKDWQLSGALTAQTGNPLTARILGNSAQLAQTNGAGSERADATGQPISAGGDFFNLNAFAVPSSGTYGNAGRNTIPGPGLINLNLAFARSFTLKERKRIEFRVESNNVLNHVNLTNLYTIVSATNYGLPSAAAGMRTLDAVVRFRF